MELNNLELWQLAGIALGGLFVVLAALAGNFWAGTKVVEQGKKFYAALKTNKETIYNAVNDPSDTIPATIPALTPWKDDPAMWSAMLEGLVKVVLHYSPPAQEVIIPAPDPSGVSDAIAQAYKKSAN